jgi:DNA-binding response OmpR family regulator
MESTRKVLIVDKSIDRKKRIAAVKNRGFAVFPALRLAEARSRCRPGAYDLVLVNAQDEVENAIAFCDSLCDRTPAQPVLLVVSGDSEIPARDYAVAEDAEALASRVESLLSTSSRENTLSSDSREEAPARASA